MVLLHRPVIVQEGKLRAGLHVEVVGGSSVLNVMDNSSQNSGQHLLLGEPLGEETSFQNGLVLAGIVLILEGNKAHTHIFFLLRRR